LRDPRWRHAGEDLFDDRSRVLAARVVARHDDNVGQPLGDRAHQRTLGRIAIATAAEHADELSATRLSDRTQRRKRFLERVGRVRIVDHDKRFVVHGPAG
jgi:hypothetical protein